MEEFNIVQIINFRQWLRDNETPKRRYDFAHNVLKPFKKRTSQGDEDRQAWHVAWLFKAQGAEYEKSQTT